MSKLICAALILLLTMGCSFVKGQLGIPPGWEELDPGWNKNIGQTKDQGIIKHGAPESCAKLSNSGEACTWVRRGMSVSGPICNGPYGCSGGGGGASWEHRFTRIYNERGICTGWSYEGSYGHRTSEDARREATTAPTKNSVQESSP